jgi:hypothetical protein
LANTNGLGGVFGVPDFLWVAGDGNTPTIGPALAVTGAPTVGTTPWQLGDETAVVSEEYDGTMGRQQNVTPVDPGAGEDAIILALVQIPRISVASQTVVATTMVQAGGWGGFRLFVNMGNLIYRSYDTAGAFVQSTLAVIDGSWALVGVIIDESANQHLISGSGLDVDNIAALGNFADGNGIGVAVLPRIPGIQRYNGKIAFVSMTFGAGIADLWTANAYALFRDFESQMTGTWPIQGARGTFARASAASWQNRNGVWAIASSGLSRSGDSEGFRVAPSRTNQAYRNINPQAGDAAIALTWTGAVAPTEVNDAAALAAVANDATAWGPNVFEYANTTGAVQYIRMSAQTGDVNARSLQCLIRRTAGAGAVNLGLYDESAGTFVGSAISDGYNARTLINGQTPGDVDETLCLEVANGTTVRWIAQDMSAGATCQTPIPNYSTGAVAIRVAEVLTTTLTPDDAEGSVEVHVTPLGWNQADVIGTPRIVTRVVSSLIMYASNFGWRSFDGTNVVRVPGIVDGTEYTIRVRYGDSGLSITVNDIRDNDLYDGTLHGGGAFEIEPGEEVEIKDFRHLRNGGG